MSAQENAEIDLGAIAKQLADSAAKLHGAIVAFSSYAPRGVGAGGTIYKNKPRRKVEALELATRIRKAYEDVGAEVPMSDAEAAAYMAVLLYAVKAEVQTGAIVDLGNLVFEARVRKDGTGTYIWPHPAGKEYTSLDATMETKDCPELVARKREAAKKRPFDSTPTVWVKKPKGDKDAKATCPYCGKEFMVHFTK